MFCLQHLNTCKFFLCLIFFPLIEPKIVWVREAGVVICLSMTLCRTKALRRNPRWFSFRIFFPLKGLFQVEIVPIFYLNFCLFNYFCCFF